MSAQSTPEQVLPASPSPTPPMLPVSAYVVCKDEAETIEACLRSVGFASQIVVVDSGSTDGTLEIVRRLADEGLPIELHEREWPGYAAQKQWALNRCTAEWCFNIDGDEACEPGFGERLAPILARTQAAGLKVLGRFEIYGYGPPPPGTALYWLRRLSRRGAARFDLTTRVHEHLVIDGAVEGCSDLVIRHYRPDPLEPLLGKQIRYGVLKAEQHHAAGRRGSILKLIANPPYVFLRHYIGRRYFKTGVHGLIAAGTFAIYAFVTEARLFELRHELRSRSETNDAD